MHAADINAAMIKAGTNQTKLAAQIGVDQSLVSLVVHGKSRNPRVAAAIANATGLPIERLFPSRHPQAPSRTAA
jgi:lambda repressor-like predicted transcriptional regulator